MERRLSASAGIWRRPPAARSAFDRLGAVLDAARAAEALSTQTDATGWAPPCAGTRTLRSLFASHGGTEVDHPGDGVFIAIPEARAGLECGVAIQGRLLEHRRTQGFASQVRIALHTAAAQRVDRAYRGKGVHVVPRLAAAAEGGEILVSRDTVEVPVPGIRASAP